MRALSRIDWGSQRFCDNVFVVVVSISLALRMFLLVAPEGSLIFDEYYYVNSARAILGLPQSTDERGAVPYPGAPRGIDPNHEHPPLAKLLIALSIRLLGDNAYGWRIPSVLLGVLSIIVLYELIRRGTGPPHLGLFGSFLFAFDSLVFVHSRIATLDIYALAFMLLSFYLYLRGQPLFSGVAMGLSALCKETGFSGAAVLMMYTLLQPLCKVEGPGPRYVTKRPRLRALFPLGLFAIGLGATFFLLLYILDNLWGGYTNPIEHIMFIYTYAAELVSVRGPVGIGSYPWQWLLNEVQIPYLKVNVGISENGREVGSYTTIGFVGAMNPFIIFLTIPAIAYQAYLWKRDRKPYPLFLIAWFALTYLPYYPMALIGHRIMYLFYFLNTVPSVCAAVASMVSDTKLPKVVVLAYALSVVAGFAASFPFKRFT